ncbi:hypothetical protein AYK25_01525 [Thermoplasmatales archaeon SM1-50]|nr:MAG: hypothetical protein AYK25_01525 [Thermoplasmatales archaeon SM1-50]
MAEQKTRQTSRKIGKNISLSRLRKNSWITKKGMTHQKKKEKRQEGDSCLSLWTCRRQSYLFV